MITCKECKHWTESKNDEISEFGHKICGKITHIKTNEAKIHSDYIEFGNFITLENFGCSLGEKRD